MNKFKLFIILFVISMTAKIHANAQQNYWDYHQTVLKAEQLITEENYAEALETFEVLFVKYDFVFLREYRVAAQLAAYLGEKAAAFQYIRKGIEGGWKWKYLKKVVVFNTLKNNSEWKIIQQEYNILRVPFEAKQASTLGQMAKKMSAKDQKMAFKALFHIGDKAQARYNERKFAPHSEKQLAQLKPLLEQYGYPGQRLVGNGDWISTIIAHHNSISTAYVEKDTLYPQLKPRLMQAVKKGELSPYQFAFIDDWYVAVKTDRQVPGYGYLSKIPTHYVNQANKLRADLSIRSITLRNQLVDIQEKTAMNFYLWTAPWLKGKIIPYTSEQ